MVVVVTLRVGFSGIGDDAIGETTSLQGGTVERERERVGNLRDSSN